MDIKQANHTFRELLGYLFVFTFVLPVIPFLLLEIYKTLFN